MKKATIQLEQLVCPSCMQKINNAVKSVNGVVTDSVNVMFNASKVKVDYDDSQTSIDEIEKSITKMGYEIIKSSVK